MQTINSSIDYAKCDQCGTNLVALGNFKYDGVTVNTPRRRDEECHCTTCSNKFILRYELFDEEGHINPTVFNGDINDASFNWVDDLTTEQRREIEKHLKDCKICTDRLEEEILSDALLAAVIHKR